MDYQIIKAKKEDAHYIIELIKKRIAWMKAAGIQQWDDGYLDFYTIDKFERDAEQGRLYFAMRDTVPAGAFVLLEEDDRWCKDTTPAYYVHNFVTDVGEKNLGGIILDWCKEQAAEKNKTMVRLDMLTGNTKLADYYTKHGFTYVSSFESKYYCGDRMQYQVNGFEHLYAAAKSVTNPRALSANAEAGEVGAALLAESGMIYKGVCIDTACSMGFCAEHAAAAAMITAGESRILKMIAVGSEGNIMSPCGRCREFICQIHADNCNTEVMVRKNKIATMKELLPYSWQE